MRLRIPGIARFPQADAGRRVEERQRCVLEPRDVRGHLPEPQVWGGGTGCCGDAVGTPWG